MTSLLEYSVALTGIYILQLGSGLGIGLVSDFYQAVQALFQRQKIYILNPDQVQITPSNHSRTNLGEVVLVYFWKS